MSDARQAGVAWFNGADESAARAALQDVCAARGWADALLAARPYADADALLAANDAAIERLGPAGLDEALAGHPPIGRPTPGDSVSGAEQRGMSGASPALRAEMLELNRAYQERFGHVFLVCATGLGAEELRDALRARLHHPPDVERGVVRTELARINRLRLTRLVAGAVRSAP
ncbi:2-oxo-4-hydroxy-4-carboxy-5-ureidoimidazoline decarboxylase [Streptomyces sp. B6B3]|uniref:2-oxo-4-hydroxy-4-carboxy-5-ureidoimidazoline decarboxylase n=1 Tax=Streptomyces sp. B6B3 TaxID=3153570 RepID=UPI00325C6FB0